MGLSHGVKSQQKAEVYKTNIEKDQTKGKTYKNSIIKRYTKITNQIKTKN